MTTREGANCTKKALKLLRLSRNRSVIFHSPLGRDVNALHACWGHAVPPQDDGFTLPQLIKLTCRLRRREPFANCLLSSLPVSRTANYCLGYPHLHRTVNRGRTQCWTV